MEKTKQLNLTEKVWVIKLEIPKLKKATKGFKFKYTNLGDVEKTLRPILIKRKVGYEHTTRVNELGNILVTTIFDLEDFNSTKVVELLIPNDVQLAGMNGYQSLGSALTYFKRYNLVTAFGILTDDDADAQTPQKTVRPPAEKVDHFAKLNQLITIKRPKATLEKYFSMYAKEMTADQQAKAKELISKV